MDRQHTRRLPFWKSPFAVVSTLVAVAASTYLYMAQKDHVLALLPLAHLAPCPLMYMFRHRDTAGVVAL